MKMLDLYSGLGGASEAFLQNGWEVLRLENNPLLEGVPETEITDILEWDFEIMGDTPMSQIDLIWSSPPCREFSNAYNAPKSKAKRAGEEFKPNFEHVIKTMEIIKWVNPRYFVIENVRGAIQDFKHLLGNPRQIVGSWALWGNFPYMHIKNFHEVKEDAWSDNPLRANIRAKIPYPLSDSLRIAIESQRSLLEWV